MFKVLPNAFLINVIPISMFARKKGGKIPHVQLGKSQNGGSHIILKLPVISTQDFQNTFLDNVMGFQGTTAPIIGQLWIIISISRCITVLDLSLKFFRKCLSILSL